MGGMMAGEKKTKKTKEKPEKEKVKDQEKASPEKKADEKDVAQVEETKDDTPVETEGQQIVKEQEQEEEGAAEEEKPAQVLTQADLKKPLDKMTAKELREVALGIPGVSGVHAMKKEALLTTITSAWGIKEEKPPKKAVKAKGAVSVADLKAKIRDMKAKRAEAIQKKDKRMTGIYRRKINRLKKRTRRAA